MSTGRPERPARRRERLDRHARQARILAESRVDPALRVADLAARFAVSTETIRRDLDALAAQGLVARTYGGAAASPGAEPRFNERYRLRVAERQRMAAVAAALVADGEVLMIDAGASTTHFARRLAATVTRLSVFTNSVGVATALAANAGIRVVLCPGDYDLREGGVCGAETQAFVHRLRAAWCFVGASGLTVEGPGDANPDAAWVKRAMIARSERQALLVDASKFGVRSVDRICALDELSDLICDQRPERPLVRALAGAGVKVHIAAARTRARAPSR